MANNSRALPRMFYGDPLEVVERIQRDELGCRLCVNHRVVLGGVICTHHSNELQRGVPGIGYRCKFFKEMD
ncbi:hypothetical protein [Nitrosomonas aestuarii]|uniref:hypothetical protein n=1 Tax=Nitrosomonas aestuarii TaxID=52441 RepID=UPI00111440F7|nr:hypothetical protein [Nitrosomonas aestuarii]